MIVHRICKAKYAGSAFSGAGGMEASGRWHRKGHPVVYSAQSLSLASLEYLVHLGSRETKLDLMRVAATIPDDVATEIVNIAHLPMNWFASPPIEVTMDLGMAWLQSRRSLILQTPSALSPGEFNYLINPQHPDFSRIVVGSVEPHTFDTRLVERG